MIAKIETSKMSGNFCCVPGCGNRQGMKKIKFFCFPYGSEEKFKQRQAWISAINKKNEDGSSWKVKDYSRVCSAHFARGVHDLRETSPSYKPTIFPARGKSFLNYLLGSSKKIITLSLFLLFQLRPAIYIYIIFF